MTIIIGKTSVNLAIIVFYNARLAFGLETFDIQKYCITLTTHVSFIVKLVAG